MSDLKSGADNRLFYQKLRSWKKRSSDFSQLHGQCKYVPSWQSNQRKCKSYTTERVRSPTYEANIMICDSNCCLMLYKTICSLLYQERKQRIDDNIKALAKLLPHEVKV